MTQRLIVLMADRKMGQVELDAQSRMRLVYEEEWRQARGAYPLSVSMPLTAETHPHTVIEAFLWGLLPDNEFVLSRWAQKFQVSPRNAFALISNVGEDCAGAAQFIRPERLEEVTTGRGAIEWLDEAAVAQRLRDLRADHSAWRSPRDTGQFSLAGAQPKTALLLQEGRWGVPSGRIPTTHILKPPAGEFDGHAENELFCLMLAQELGLPAANATVVRFQDEPAIVIERYDRVRTGRELVRVHQEDMCQALGLPPTKKYENEDGPGVKMTTQLIRDTSTVPEEDVWTFIRAIALNWLIAGTDAHAKNYSLLIAGGGARLSPLYDVASALPYETFDPLKLKLAMKLGGEYRLRDITVRNWCKLATETRLPEDAVITHVREMTERIPDAATKVRGAIKKGGFAHPLIDRLAEMVAGRAKALLIGLQRSG